MTTKQKLHQLHLNEWATRFAEQKASGLTAQLWCTQNNISIHAYNYWKHLLKQEVVDQMLPEIVPLPLSSGITTPEIPQSPLPLFSANCANRTIRATAKLTLNNVCIEVDDSISETFLQSLIKVVRHA